MNSGQTDTEAIYREVVGEGCGCPVDTSAKQKHRPRRQPRPLLFPRKNEAVTRRVILSLPKFYDNEIPPHTSARFAFDFAQNDLLS